MSDEPDLSQELRQHPGWWARLEGEAFDLEVLDAALGESSRVQVYRLDGRYYMRMDEVELLDGSGDVETRAGEVLRILNGAARVQHGDNSEVRVDAVARVQPDGQIQNFVHLSATIRARPRVSATVTVNGEARSPVRELTITERALETGLNDPPAERALRIFGRDDVDYRDLYHVLEIAEATIGSGIHVDGTVTRAEITRFKHTANSVHALGDQARHGHEPTQPPPQPMSFEEAQALVGRVLRAWLSPSP